MAIVLDFENTFKPTIRLAAHMVEACVSKKPRVIYPAFYDLAARAPRLAATATSAFGPKPKGR